MTVRTKVLDHGYVEWIESWGCDQRIIEAARMSTNKGFLGWDPGPCGACSGTGKNLVLTAPIKPGDMAGLVGAEACAVCDGSGQLKGDRKLLKYLYSHWHMSPFEFAGMVIEVKAPIFVFREWHRHRTQSYNEMSARYIPLPDENYVPGADNIATRIATGNGNRQTGQAFQVVPTHPQIEKWLADLVSAYAHAQAVYDEGLVLGIPKEIARCPVPVARYSKMRAAGNLRNLLAFLTLRNAKGVLWEMREYAKIVDKLIQINFPETHALYVEGRVA